MRSIPRPIGRQAHWGKVWGPSLCFRLPRWRRGTATGVSSPLWEACERVQKPADHGGRSLARRWDDRFGPLEPPPSLGAGTGRAVPRADSNHMLERSRVRCSAAPGAWPSWACHSRFSLPEWQLASRRGGWGLQGLRSAPVPPPQLSTLDLPLRVDPGAGPQSIPACGGPVQVRSGP